MTKAWTELKYVDDNESEQASERAGEECMRKTLANFLLFYTRVF